jgi:carnosine N-methyltransferase
MYPNPHPNGGHSHGNAKQPLNPPFMHSHNGVPCFGHGQQPLQPTGPILSPQERAARDEKEQRNNIVQSFMSYSLYVFKGIDKLERDYKMLPDAYKIFIPDQLTRAKTLRDCTLVNAMFLKRIVEDEKTDNDGFLQFFANPSADFHLDRVRVTLKQIAREWSDDGKEERNSSFRPIIDQLLKHLPVTDEARYKHRVLCPGSGLGRLAWEICKAGYVTEANEYSTPMILTTKFLRNKTQRANEFKIHPYIQQYTNTACFDDQIFEVTFPDVNPRDLPKEAIFTENHGEFLATYKPQKESWDAVCTCFFIDTAVNVIEYIEAIWGMLKPGGVWVNFGPLLYHFSGNPKEMSIELTVEQILRVAKAHGFKMEHEVFIATTYTGNKRSMQNTLYNCAFFTAKKPL